MSWISQPEGETPLPASVLADETGKGADSYARFGERLTRYAKARHRASAMSKYIAGLGLEDHDTKRVSREIEACGTYLVFRHYLESDRVRLHGLRSCRQHIICPLCAIRRGARMLARYLQRVELVMAEKPDLKAYMVTLTVKNGEDLVERFAHVSSAVQALGKTRHRERSSSEFEKALGAVYSYEFKRGEGSGLWHPHVHAVWLCEEAPRQVQLSAEWKAITGDSFIVEIHALYGELVEAFCEVFKYAVKFGDLPLEDNWEAFQSLRRRQLIGSVGNLRGVHIPSDLTDELLDELLWIDLMYRYLDRGGDQWGYALEHASPSVERENLPAYEPFLPEVREFIRTAHASG